MMFRFESVVKAILITGVSSTAAVAGANSGTPASTTNNEGLGSYYRDVEARLESMGCNNPTERAKKEQECRRLEARLPNNNGGGQSCNQTRKDFNDNADGFVRACSNLGMPTDSQTGAIGCSWSKERCRCLSRNVSESDRAHYRCEEVSSEEPESDRSASREAQRSLGLINLEQAKKKMEYCLDAAAEDVEKFEKQMEKTQDRLKELKRKLPELEQATNDIQSQTEEKMSEIKRESRQAQQEYQKQQKEARRNLENTQKQLAQQLTQMQQQMDQVDEAIGQLDQAKREADLKYQDALTQIDLNCHASASQQVVKLQTDRLELERNRRFNRGGFDAMMRQVGVSDRQAWQKVAQRYYEFCVQSKPTKESKKAAARTRDSALEAAERGIRNQERRKDGIRNQMARIKDRSGCSGQAQMQADGSSSETEMCQALRQAQEDLAQLQVDFQAQQAELGEKYGKAQADGFRKLQTKQRELALANQELMEENARMDNLRRYLDLKADRISGTAGKKQVEEFHVAWSKLTGSARSLATNPDCCPQGTTDANCTRARGFLDSLNRSEPISSPPGSNAIASPPTPAGPGGNTPARPAGTGLDPQNPHAVREVDTSNPRGPR